MVKRIVLRVVYANSIGHRVVAEFFLLRIGIKSSDPNYVALIGLARIAGVSEAIASAVVAFQVVEVLKFIVVRGARTLKIFEFTLEVGEELCALWWARRFRGVGYARGPWYQRDSRDCR